MVVVEGSRGCLCCNISDQPSAQRHKAGTRSELQLQHWHLFIYNTYLPLLTWTRLKKKKKAHQDTLMPWLQGCFARLQNALYNRRLQLWNGGSLPFGTISWLRFRCKSEYKTLGSSFLCWGLRKRHVFWKALRVGLWHVTPWADPERPSCRLESRILLSEEQQIKAHICQIKSNYVTVHLTLQALSTVHSALGWQ